MLDVIEEAHLLPVVVLASEDAAVDLANALLEGGLPVAEVTFRTSAAASAIRAIRASCPQMAVGAGTVLTVEQVKLAADAGAQFIVTPGFNPRVVEAALAEGLPIVPGINNPTGVEQAMAFGLKAVKFFPAEPSGGVGFLKALSGPYPDMRFVPTGGIGLANLSTYLSQAFVLACGGSWMVDAKLIASDRFDQIARLTSEAVTAARTARPGRS